MYWALRRVRLMLRAMKVFQFHGQVTTQGAVSENFRQQL